MPRILAVEDERTVLRTGRDTGIGIPPEHLPHVFDRFHRADKGRSRAQGGMGLGLSIARSILAAHGGRIELAGTAGQGAPCPVTLPAGPASANGFWAGEA